MLAVIVGPASINRAKGYEAMGMLSRTARKSICIVSAACSILSGCIADSAPEHQVGSVAQHPGDSQSTVDVALIATDGKRAAHVELTPDARHAVLEHEFDSVAQRLGDSQSIFDVTLTATDGERAVHVEFTPDARHVLEAVDTSRADGAPAEQIDKERIARMLQARLADLPVGTVSRVIVTESFDKQEGASVVSGGCLVITGSVYTYTLVYNAGMPSQYCRTGYDWYSNATFNQCTGRLEDNGTYCCSTLSDPYAC